MPIDETIGRFDFDVSAAEAKARRLMELVDELKRRTAAGGDVGGLQVEIERESAAIAKLTAGQKEAAGAADDLLRNKQQLSAAVSLLGGRFGPMIGQLGSIVELMGSLGLKAGVVGASLAALTGMVQWAADLKRELEGAAAAMEKLETAQARASDRTAKEGQTIEADLNRLGAGGAGLSEAAFGLYEAALRRGVPKDQAQSLASIGSLAGLDAEGVSLLAAAGLKPGSAEQAVSMLGKLRGDPAVLSEMQAAAAATAAGSAGAAARYHAAEIARLRSVDPRLAERVAGTSADALLHRRAIEVGVLKADAPLDRIDELRAEVPDLRESLARMDKAGYGSEPSWTVAGRQFRLASERLRMLGFLEGMQEQLDTLGMHDVTGPMRSQGASLQPAPGAAAGGFSPRTTTVIQNVTNIGSQTVLEGRRSVAPPGAVNPGSGEY